MVEKSTNIKERILQIAEYKKVSKEEFLSSIGQTYGNYKGKSKDSVPSTDVLVEISSKYPDVSIDWVLSGEGSMIRTYTVQPRTQRNESVALPVDTNVSRILLAIRDEQDYNKRRELLDQVQVMYSKLQAEKEEVTKDLLDLLKKLKNF